MTPNTAQPIPDTEGEWSYTVVTGRHKIHNAQGQQVATADSEESAAQIVADHKAAKSQALLVEAWRGVAIMLNTELKSFECEPWAQKVRAALKAAGVNE
jgi:hypothetical protein